MHVGPRDRNEGRPPESRDGGEEPSLPTTKRVCTEDRISGLEVASAHGELPTLTTPLPQQYQHQSCHHHLQQSSHQPFQYPLTHHHIYPFPQDWLSSPYLLPPHQPPHQPSYYPSPLLPHPPPFRLQMGEPNYERSRFFQPPYYQSSHHPSSQPSPHPDTPLGKYALFLRECYTLHKAPSTKFPYLYIQSYVNLAVISSEYANREELIQFRQQTIHGCVDDILEWKAPIAMKDILKPNYVCHGGETEECLVTQLLIEGAPGIGKSTFAWEVCQKWGEGSSKPSDRDELVCMCL